MPFFRFIAAGCLVSALWTLGCSRGEILGRVEGRVTFEGRPVAKAYILFQNVEKGVYIMAPLNNEGRYRVEMDKGYGLPLGSYGVSLSPPPPDRPEGPVIMEPPPPPKSDEYPDIPAKYRDPATSGLKLEVQEGVVNRLDVNMRSE